MRNVSNHFFQVSHVAGEGHSCFKMSKVKATPALPSASHCQLPSRFTTASTRAPSLRGSNTWETNLINRNFATMRSLLLTPDLKDSKLRTGWTQRKKNKVTRCCQAILMKAIGLKAQGRKSRMT